MVSTPHVSGVHLVYWRYQMFISEACTLSCHFGAVWEGYENKIEKTKTGQKKEPNREKEREKRRVGGVGG